MGFPQPPWRSQGLCFSIFYLVPTAKVRPLVPGPFEISEVLPGMTLGGLFAAKYSGGDLGEMSEFGVLPAYVRYKDKKGFFMRESSVDNEDAAEGCRKIWGMDKQMSGFNWDLSGSRISLDVTSGGKPLIGVSIRPVVKELPFSACFPFLCLKGKNVVFFKHQFASKIGLCMSSVTIPDGSPLHGLPFRLKILSAYWEASNIVLQEPEYVTENMVQRAEKAFGSPVGRHPHKP